MFPEILDESWDILKTQFPSNWQKLARESGSLVRKLRRFKSEEEIMRTLLLHLANGYSLRETVTRAKLSGLADVTDVALLKRLQCSENWFKSLCMSLLKERNIDVEKAPHYNIRMRIVDGTVVKEPGKTGSQWRVHYALKLPDLTCDYFKLTPTQGRLTGESFKQYPVRKNDCMIGDRGHSTVEGIAYVEKKEAYSLVRVNTGALPLFNCANTDKFALFETLSDLQEDYSSREYMVRLKTAAQGWIQGRLCVLRKSQAAITIAVKKLRKNASKRQSTPHPHTVEFSKYVIVFTTLPATEFSTDDVLEWYRLRWQIELVFKRLKSLTAFGHLPKYDEVSARSWLYGKLFVGLLTEKLLLVAQSVSPWGYGLPGKNEKSLERV